jgi:hypothetical protein
VEKVKEYSFVNFPEPLRRVARGPAKYALSAWYWKRLQFTDAPPIFGNAKPKSGSHLLLQILGGMCRVAPYAYAEEQPIRTITPEGRRRSQEEILEDLRRIPPGVIGWGYLDATPENISFLCRPNRVNYFIYRDPRDMLVSHVFYATEMHKGHGMHEYYQSLPNFDERLKVAITGIHEGELHLSSVRERYESVFQWLETSQVMPIRFEDLINNRSATLHAMLDEIEKTGYEIPTPREEAIQILEQSVQPKKSRTFRSGKTGTWKKHFKEEHKRLFLDVAGDLLIRLGYEEDDNW